MLGLGSIAARGSCVFSRRRALTEPSVREDHRSPPGARHRSPPSGTHHMTHIVKRKLRTSESSELVVVKLQAVQRGKRVRGYLPNRYRIGTIIQDEPLTFDIGGEWIRADQVTRLAQYWRLTPNAYHVRKLLRTLSERHPQEFYRLDDLHRFLARFRRRDAPDRAPLRRRQFPEEMPALRLVHPCSGIYRGDGRQLEAWYVDDHSETMIGACRIDAPKSLRCEWSMRMLRHLFWRRFHQSCPHCVSGFVKTCLAVKDFADFL